MRIPPEIIAQIQLQADIVEVVGDYVSLKKQGQNLWACCPFHNEKTPSFSVAPAKGIFKCFGCGKAGDTIKFVMEVEGVTYPEALKQLAKKYNIEIPETAPEPHEIQRQNEIDSLYIVLNFAKEFYQNHLWQSEEGKAIGLSYFKERGFRENTIQTFELGYSLASWDAFTKEALQKGYQIDLLEKAGLTIRKENQTEGKAARQYDRFRERVIFPIHNLSGRVIAFGARILKAEKSQPKYVNSPETEVYHKSKVLFGMYQAKNAIRQEDNCYLVEGYTDVISLHQAGIANVVASSGTSLTEEQVQLIRRFTKNITILYDGDEAGIKASVRGTILIFKEELNVEAVKFPDNDDPDSYLNKVGVEKFRHYIETNRLSIHVFAADIFLKDTGNDPIRKANAYKNIVELVSYVIDPLKKSAYTKNLAERYKLDEQSLIHDANQFYLKRREQERNKNQTELKKEDKSEKNNSTSLASVSEILPEGVTTDKEVDAHVPVEIENLAGLRKSSMVYQEEESIRLLISYADHVIEGTDDTVCEYILREVEELEFITPVYNRIIQVFREELSRGQIIGGDYFLRHPDPEIQRVAIDLVSSRYHISDSWSEKFEIYIPREKEMLLEVAYSNVLRLKQRVVQEKIRHNMQALAGATQPEEQDRLLAGVMQLKSIEKQIAGILGNVIRPR